ncbi:hypothetical protein MHBO_001082 [Bonamia ostreae]|uniref:Sushi domain-containing protein n=1 Tax=Bonamia ostreae TaxID=126728 RepID=A0ABV2AIZ9_9EUKA
MYCPTNDLYSTFTTGNCSGSKVIENGKRCSLRCRLGLQSKQNFSLAYSSCYNGVWVHNIYKVGKIFSKNEFLCTLPKFLTNSTVVMIRDKNSECDLSKLLKDKHGISASSDCGNRNKVSSGQSCTIICQIGKFVLSENEKLRLVCEGGSWFAASVEEGGIFAKEVSSNFLICSVEITESAYCGELPDLKNGEYVKSECGFHAEGSVCRFMCYGSRIAMPYDKDRSRTCEGVIWCQNGKWVIPMCSEKLNNGTLSFARSENARSIINWENCVMNSIEEVTCCYTCIDDYEGPFIAENELNIASGYIKFSVSAWTKQICLKKDAENDSIDIDKKNFLLIKSEKSNAKKIESIVVTILIILIINS